MADNVPKMEYVRLGNSGLQSSRIILGCMSYGSSKWQDWVLDEEEALPLLEHAWKCGINTWDTADVYSHGLSERLIAKAISTYSIPRHKLVLLSKCYFGVQEDNISAPISYPPSSTPSSAPATASASVSDIRSQLGIASAPEGRDLVNQVGLSRKHIFDAVQKSVERLGTYIDVLQIHRLDRGTGMEEIMRALNDVVERGWVRYIGASSMAAWEFQMLQNIAEKHGWHKFISMQNYHNLLYREEEREMIPYCKATGVALIPWSPIARGALTRPYTQRDTKRSQTDRFASVLVYSRNDKVDQEIISRVEQVAKKHNVSMACIATAWSIKQGCCPIIGMNSRERIEEAVRNAGFKLSDEDAEFLEEPYLPKSVMGY